MGIFKKAFFSILLVLTCIGVSWAIVIRLWNASAFIGGLGILGIMGLMLLTVFLVAKICEK
jgi:hypothetical protein